MKYVVMVILVFAALFYAYRDVDQPKDTKEETERARKRYEENCRKLLLEREAKDVELDKE